jgi:cytochrome d ubiquinol oxidase subunit II
MSLAELMGCVLLGALLIYAVLGGADFGGGVWDLFASGPRAAQQRKLIEKALAPVWEANHVWLILAVVLLFGCFPVAFSVITTALHVPLSLMLLGIVLRGSAFTIRQYDTTQGITHLKWGRVFAISSVITPLFLGIIVGALSAGEIRVENDIPVTGFFAPWFNLFSGMVGLFTLALFSFLAAVFLIHETDDVLLQNDFRKRALYAAIAVGVFALATGWSARGESLHEFRGRLLGSWWSILLQITTAATALGVFFSLWKRHFRMARILAAAQVCLIISGWAFAQFPYLIAPDVRLEAAAAPAQVLRITFLILGLGLFVLVPSLFWLFRIFKFTSKK